MTRLSWLVAIWFALNAASMFYYRLGRIDWSFSGTFGALTGRENRVRFNRTLRQSPDGDGGLSGAPDPRTIGMHALLGHLLPMGMPRHQSLVDRIRHGRAFLRRLAQVDLGSD